LSIASNSAIATLKHSRPLLVFNTHRKNDANHHCLTLPPSSIAIKLAFPHLKVQQRLEKRIATCIPDKDRILTCIRSKQPEITN
jgi:hypothetical protein